MSIRKLLILSIVLANTAAFADSPRYTATLAQPVNGEKNIVAEANMWRCVGSVCTLVSSPHDANSVHSCHALVKQVGNLTAYGLPGSEFNSDKLGKCNSSG